MPKPETQYPKAETLNASYSKTRNTKPLNMPPRRSVPAQGRLRRGGASSLETSNHLKGSETKGFIIGNRARATSPHFN